MESTPIEELISYVWEDDAPFPSYVQHDEESGKVYCRKGELPAVIEKSVFVPFPVNMSMIGKNETLTAELYDSVYLHPTMPCIIQTPPLLLILSCLPNKAREEALNAEITKLSSSTSSEDCRRLLASLYEERRMMKYRHERAKGGCAWPAYICSHEVLCLYADMFMTLKCMAPPPGTDEKSWNLMVDSLSKVCKEQLDEMQQMIESKLYAIPEVQKFMTYMKARQDLSDMSPVEAAPLLFQDFLEKVEEGERPVWDALLKRLFAKIQEDANCLTSSTLFQECAGDLGVQGERMSLGFQNLVHRLIHRQELETLSDEEARQSFSEEAVEQLRIVDANWTRTYIRILECQLLSFLQVPDQLWPLFFSRFKVLPLHREEARPLLRSLVNHVIRAQQFKNYKVPGSFTKEDVPDFREDTTLLNYPSSKDYVRIICFLFFGPGEREEVEEKSEDVEMES